MKKNRKEKKYSWGPVFSILLMIALIIIASAFCSLIGLEGQKTAIVNGALETSLVTVRNMLSLDGIKYILQNAIVNFSLFEPFLVLVIALIGVGIGEASGLWKALFAPFKKLSSKTMTFLVLLIGISSSFIGEYCFVLVLPMVAMLYKYSSRNIKLGLFTAFIGLSIGYGTGIIFNYHDVVLGQMTELAAQIDIDKNYHFNLWSNLFIMIASTGLLSIIGTIVIEHLLAPKLSKSIVPIEEEMTVSKKALYFSNFALVIMILLLLYALIPGYPGSGLLLDPSQPTLLAKIFSENAPFQSSIVFLFTLMMMIYSLIYGLLSRNFKSLNDYNDGLSKAFDGLGYLFVLFFFFSQLLAVLNWTNLGEVVIANLTDLLGQMQLSGIPLIIIFFVFVLIASFLVPSSATKWILMSPIVIPVFMRSNMTPEFTQFIFKVADGVGKTLTPFFPYFFVFLAFLHKYKKEGERITLWGTMRTMRSTILILIGLWLLILLGWYIIGLPLGFGSSPTL